MLNKLKIAVNVDIKDNSKPFTIYLEGYQGVAPIYLNVDELLSLMKGLNRALDFHLNEIDKHSKLLIR